MPTPLGHAVAGAAAAFLTHAAVRRPHLTMPVVLSAAALAVAPDLDILVGSHRTFTHSVAAPVVVGVAAWIALRRAPNALPLSVALAAAVASHALLDFLGKDTSSPAGLMLWWPFSYEYHKSGWDIFGEVSRRYWRPEEFIFGNLQALAWEMVLLVPLFVFAWAIWSRKTIR
jgi:membrane-bound metal-dependent hydrolase YbcI (DUF457 family)